MLTHWDPWSDLRTGRVQIDRLFGNSDRVHARTRATQYAASGNLALDVAEVDGSYVVTASLPGFSPEEVDVSITDRAVTVSAESKDRSDDPDGTPEYVLRERYDGKRSRTVVLPDEVNTDESVAEHRDGVLTLKLPKTVIERTKKIAVTTG
jgi:HSP20 family protein